MKEYLRVFDPDTQMLVSIRERDELYREMLATVSRLERDGKRPLSPFTVEIVQLLLVNPLGEVYVCQRSPRKRDNPGLYDKTVGGHVIASTLEDDASPSLEELATLVERCGEDFDTALIRETYEELSIDVRLTDEIRFHEILRETDLSRHAVVRRVGYNPDFVSRRITEGLPWFLRERMALYFGVYDGPVTYQGDEVVQHVTLSRSELDFFLRHEPEILTSDIRQIMLDYSPQIQAFTLK